MVLSWTSEILDFKALWPSYWKVIGEECAVAFFLLGEIVLEKYKNTLVHKTITWHTTSYLDFSCVSTLWQLALKMSSPNLSFERSPK